MDVLTLIYSTLALMVIVGGIGFGFFWQRKAVGPYLSSSEDSTYLIKHEGQIKPVDPSMKIRPGSSQIIDFARRNHLPYPKFSAQTQTLTYGNLVAEDGEVSLHVHTATPWPFTCQTKDNHIVTITTAVSFAVEKDRARNLAKLDNFGEQFERRIHSVFASEIGRCKDEQLRERIGEIETQVTQLLEEMENGAGDVGIPLGIRVFEARFSFQDGDHVPGRAPPPTPAPSPDADADPDAPTVAGIIAKPVIAATPPQVQSAAPLHEFPGAMQFSGTDLDRLLDQFDGRTPEQINALMKLMDLQTRQNIVALLARTNSIIVFSADELGLSGNELLKTRLEEAKKAADPPDEGGDGAD